MWWQSTIKQLYLIFLSGFSIWNEESSTDLIHDMKYNNVLILLAIWFHTRHTMRAWFIEQLSIQLVLLIQLLTLLWGLTGTSRTYNFWNTCIHTNSLLFIHTCTSTVVLALCRTADPKNCFYQIFYFTEKYARNSDWLHSKWSSPSELW